ncbi:S-layer homology domain-containing protein [Collinsella tanakaei]|uniref:S-layer homology domain-containing protein n=1 Tax=Collinsella tanakaei TaxID=626935 RepID=UPI0019567B22|nr:S-layer homology domain-containing protein [Collinsella tanakaei]MBM6779899.1 S-layer homology domain-containing protein [Collinsella tanakaei]
MTACVNRKHSRRVAAVISASLVGALSLGIAPVAAMANEGDIELLVNQGVEFTDGEITAAEDEAGNVYEGDALKNVTFADDGVHYLIPTEVTIDGKAYEVGDEYEGAEIKVTYYKAGGTDAFADGTQVTWLSDSGAGINAAGTYYAAVYLEGTSGAGVVVPVKFTLKAASLDDAYICDGTDADDKVIEYKDKTLSFSADTLNVAVDGKIIEGYSVTVYKQDGLEPVRQPGVKDAGEYFARVTYNGQTKDIPFEVKAIDLASAKIEFADGNVLYGDLNDALPTEISKIDGMTVTKDTANKDEYILGGTSIKLSCDYTGNYSTPQKGEYTYTLNSWAVGDASHTKPGNNVYGTTTVTVVRYENEAEFTYRGTELKDSSTIFDFDASQVKAYDKLTSGREEIPVEIAYYEYDEDTKDYTVPVTAEQVKTPGKYQAEIKAVDSTYTYGGIVKVNFEIAATQVESDEVYVRYNGEAVSAGETVDIYSGSDLMPNLTVDAKDIDGNPVDASEFDVTVTDSDGEEVTEIVDAGTYTVTVKSKDGSMYEIANNSGNESITFKIDAVNAVYGDVQTGTTGTPAKPVYEYLPTGNAQLRFAGTMTYGTDKATTYLYTGEPVVPTFEYDLIADVQGYDESEEWIALPADSYKASYQMKDAKTGKWSKVDECVEPGTYKVTLTDSRADANHDVEFEHEFTITKDRVFNDVLNDQWFSEYVYKAAQEGWMNGYAGTDFFGPEDSIKRGDVAVVLYKMAGQPWLTDDEGHKDENGNYDTGFADQVDGMYYNEAIAWAKAAGIVTGDTGTNMFRAEDTISRQELAVMLGRYAALCKEDVAGAEADLSAYTDAASVADWAEDGVSYLVEAGVMGQDVDVLRPTDPINRAEVATMVVRLSDVFDFDLLD